MIHHGPTLHSFLAAWIVRKWHRKAKPVGLGIPDAMMLCAPLATDCMPDQPGLALDLWRTHFGKKEPPWPILYAVDDSLPFVQEVRAVMESYRLDGDVWDEFVEKGAMSCRAEGNAILRWKAQQEETVQRLAEPKRLGCSNCLKRIDHPAVVCRDCWEKGAPMPKHFANDDYFADDEVRAAI